MNHHELAKTVCSAQYKAGELEIKATLFAHTEGLQQNYGILLEQQGERVTCELGSDRGAASALFFDVVYGGVTTCTLNDVVQDRLGTLF